VHAAPHLMVVQPRTAKAATVKASFTGASSVIDALVSWNGPCSELACGQATVQGQELCQCVSHWLPQEIQGLERTPPTTHDRHAVSI